MIGDREQRDDEGPVEEWGPLDAMVRLNPPPDDNGLGIPRPPAWVERYGRTVVVRHTFPDDNSATTETPHASDAAAIRGLATQVAALLRRGYTLVISDGPPSL